VLTALPAASLPMHAPPVPRTHSQHARAHAKAGTQRGSAAALCTAAARRSRSRPRRVCCEQRERAARCMRTGKAGLRPPAAIAALRSLRAMTAARPPGSAAPAAQPGRHTHGSASKPPTSARSARSSAHRPHTLPRRSGIPRRSVRRAHTPVTTAGCRPASPALPSSRQLAKSLRHLAMHKKHRRGTEAPRPTGAPQRDILLDTCPDSKHEVACTCSDAWAPA
jgi:hypothetical protein